MISLSKYKELLGEEVQGLSDEEVERIKDAQYQFVKLVFDKWAKERKLIKKLGQKEKII